MSAEELELLLLEYGDRCLFLGRAQLDDGVNGERYDELEAEADELFGRICKALEGREDR